MSGIRSYDRHSTSHPARVVNWRDDWPPQSEVPHAGEVVWDEDGDPHVVATGIPTRWHSLWVVAVEPADEGDPPHDLNLATLSRTPPTKRYRVSVGDCLTWNGREHIIEAESEADAIAKAVRVEEVEP